MHGWFVANKSLNFADIWHPPRHVFEVMSEDLVMRNELECRVAVGHGDDFRRQIADAHFRAVSDVEHLTDASRFSDQGKQPGDHVADPSEAASLGTVAVD